LVVALSLQLPLHYLKHRRKVARDNYWYVIVSSTPQLSLYYLKTQETSTAR